MKIGMIKTVEELEAVRIDWEKWQSHPNNDFAQFKMICQLRVEVEGPCVTVIEDNGQPRALLAGRLERTQFAPSLGYLKPVKIPARVLTVLHEGVLGQMDDEMAMKSVHYLWSLLGSGVADAVEFHHLSENSQLLQALRLYGSRWFCQKKPRWSTHWEMAIPEQADFLKYKVGSKQRWKIRKRQQEIESAFPGKIVWRWMNRVDDVPGFCARLEQVAARTYQRGLGVGFMDDEEHRRRVALFSRQGQFRAQILEIDGRIRAFWIGTVYRDGFYSSATGYDQDLREYELGTLVFVRMVDELAREGVRKLDFGMGDAVYKQRFGDRSWQEGTIWLFAPTAKGLVLRSTMGLFSTIDNVGRRLIQKVGGLDRLRTAWRRHLAPSKSSEKLE
jgi:hypothetical protein